MNLYNIKHPEEQVNFAQAVRQGLGKDQGLFFPEVLPKLNNIDELLALPLVAARKFFLQLSVKKFQKQL